MVLRNLRALLTLIALLGSAVAVACSGSAEGAGGVSDLDAPDRSFALPFDSLYTVGAIEGESWETFGSLNQVAFDAAGNLHVFDRQNARVIVFSPDGTFLREVGKRGEGPGELRQPLGMIVTRDGTIGILDFGVQGFSFFDTQGEFVRSVSLDMEAGLPTDGLMMHPSRNAVVAQGSGVRVRMSGNRASFSVGGSEEPAEPTTIPVRQISLDDGSETVVHEAWQPPEPGEGERVESAGGGGRMVIAMSRTVAFQPDLHLGVLPDGRYLVVDSTTYRIEVLDSLGGFVRTLERPIDPMAVSSAIEESEREYRLEQLEGGGSEMLMVMSSGGGASVGGDLQAQVNEMRRTQIENMLFADVIPVIEGLGVDWTGRIWVERSVAEPGEDGPIDIIDADGRYYGTISPDGARIPAAFGPDGLVAYIETDEYDVPSVRVMRIRTE